MRSSTVPSSACKQSNVTGLASKFHGRPSKNDPTCSPTRVGIETDFSRKEDSSRDSPITPANSAGQSGGGTEVYCASQHAHRGGKNERGVLDSFFSPLCFLYIIIIILLCAIIYVTVKADKSG